MRHSRFISMIPQYALKKSSFPITLFPIQDLGWTDQLKYMPFLLFFFVNTANVMQLKQRFNDLFYFIADFNACELSPCGPSKLCKDKIGRRRCYCKSPRQIMCGDQCISKYRNSSCRKGIMNSTLILKFIFDEGGQ
jgi:hypothetical protein